MPVVSESVRRRRAWGVMAVALAFPTLVTLVYFVWLRRFPSAVQQTAYAIGKLLQFSLPIAWIFVIQRRKPGFRRPVVRDLLFGAALGIAILAAMGALYFGWLKSALPDTALSAIGDKIEAFGVVGVPAYTALAVFYALGHSLLEEYYWRWFVFGELQRLIAWPVAIVISSLGFMAHHVFVLAQFFGWTSYLTIALSAAVAIGGAMWAGLYRRSGSLWGPWLSHALVDAGIFLVGYDLVLRGAVS